MRIEDGRSDRGRKEFAEYLLLFLNPMNPRHKDPEGYRNTIGTVAGIPFPMPGHKQAPREVRDAAIAEFHHTLRGLVNQWIDSGRLQLKANGEQPLERSVRTAVPGYAETIESRLQRFFAEYQPRVLIGGPDELFAHFGLIYFSSWESLADKSTDGLLKRAQDLALYQFVLLLDSPSKHRLFMCDECGEHFVLKRNPRREIQRGTFCPKHKAQGAAARMEALRNRQTNKLLDTAAGAWIRWQRRHRNDGQGGPEQREWVAEQVNETHGTNFKRNWVTTNLEEIRKRVEALNDGKAER